METPPGPAGPSAPPPPPPHAGPHSSNHGWNHGSMPTLYRYPDKGYLGGVCAGVARYFSVDPLLVRIGAVVLTLAGPGLVVYGLAWLLLPTRHSRPLVPWARAPRRLDGPTRILGIGLVVLAISVLWGDWWLPGDGFFLPLGLIALGVWLLLRHDGHPAVSGPDGDRPHPGAWPAPPAPPTPDAPDAGSDATDEVTAIAEGASDVTEPVTEPVDADAAASTWSWQPTGGGPGARAPWEHAEPPEPPLDPAALRRRRLLGPIVFGALLIWAGVAWLGNVDLEDALAVALCMIGIGFVLGAFIGGSRALLLPAFLVGSALALTAVLGVPLSGGIGDRTWTPRSVSDVVSPYHLGIGEGVLDLRDVAPRRGQTVTVEASVGIGHLIVYVPPDTELDITSEVTAGEAVLLGHAVEGVTLDHDRTVDGDPDSGTLALDLSIGLGQIEVMEREPSGGSATTTTSVPR